MGAVKVAIIADSLRTCKLFTQSALSHHLEGEIHALTSDPLFKSLKMLCCPTHAEYPLNELANARKALESGPTRLVERSPGDVLKAIQ